MSHIFFFFFFQAEDGIRDRSPSRGLGDVYKRQGFSMTVLSTYCKMPHLVFARKRYTVTVNGVSVSPSWFVVPSIADFRLMYRRLTINTPVYLYLAILN